MKELQAIQAELKAPKNQFNKFGGYKFRSCEDILEAVKPILAKHACSLTLSDEIMPVGNRIYVRATARLMNAAGEVDTVTASAREADEKKGMDASQITGMASSYARKYALNGLFCIDDTRDADTMDNAVQQKTAQAAPKKEVTDAAIQKAVDRIKAGEIELLDKMKESYSLKDYQLHALQDAAAEYKVNNNLK